MVGKALYSMPYIRKYLKTHLCSIEKTQKKKNQTSNLYEDRTYKKEFVCGLEVK